MGALPQLPSSKMLEHLAVGFDRVNNNKKVWCVGIWNLKQQGHE